MTTSEPLLLKAFRGENETIPVWFMRQAGRFLPEYRAIKEKYSLDEMFKTPDLAAQITCLPVDILKVDAAILFADILTLPSQMGIEVEFTKDQGPVIKNPILQNSDVNKLQDVSDIKYLTDTISLINKILPSDIPLIGFAGSPFTVLCYLVEGGSSIGFSKVLNLMHSETATYEKLMKVLTKNTIIYLNIQKKAGIKAFQLFDTWGGILREEDYRDFVLPYVQKIFSGVDLPSIYYLKNCAHLLTMMDQSGADFLSLCHTVTFGKNIFLDNTKKGIQGNFYNGLLYADMDVLERELNAMLIHTRRYRKYIFNLSHGLFPDVDVQKVQFITEKVHQFNWRLRKIR